MLRTGSSFSFLEEKRTAVLLVCLCLEVESESYLQSNRTLVAEIVQTHFVVYGRFYGDIVVQIESIAYLNRNHQIVVVLG